MALSQRAPPSALLTRLIPACVAIGLLLLAFDYFSFDVGIRPLCQEQVSVDLSPHVVDAVDGPPGEVWEKDWDWPTFDQYDPFNHTDEDQCSARSGQHLKQKIPMIIHYVFGMRPDFGGKPFNFVHYMGVLSAHVRIKPRAIYLHHVYEPSGPWWDLAKPMVTLIKARNVTAMYGNRITKPPHQADVIRLELLQRWGGIYLDLDCLVFQSFDALLHNSFVIGYEGGPEYGMGNSVMLSKPQSRFVTAWLHTYASFSDQNDWAEHSIFMPRRLAMELGRDVCVMPPHAFLFPLWSESGREFMYGEIAVKDSSSVLYHGTGWDGRPYASLYPGQYAYHIAEGAAWDQLQHYNFEYLRRMPTTRMALLMRDLVWDAFGAWPSSPAGAEAQERAEEAEDQRGDDGGDGDGGSGDGDEDPDWWKADGGQGGEDADQTSQLKQKIATVQEARARNKAIKEKAVELWADVHPEVAGDEGNILLDEVREFAKADR